MDEKRQHRVMFSNLTGCAVGISDIMWQVDVLASSEDDAMALAIELARIMNAETGMPPHGIRVSDRELRRLAFVVPERPAH